MTNLFYLVFIVLICSCNGNGNSNAEEKKSNTSTFISTDTAKLSRLINLAAFQPYKVQFQYTFINNSGTRERLTVPGPSDYFLEALLYFDTATIRKIQYRYLISSTLSFTRYTAETFNFKWLPEEVRKELLKTDSGIYHGSNDLIFGSGPYGRLWFLHDKILLISGTN